MKSYTNLEQSKKLAEILSGDSADMCWGICNETLKYKTMPYLLPWRGYTAKEHYLPCWSLAALLNIMPKHIKQNDGRTYKFHIFNDDGIVIQRWGCSYVAKDYHNRAEYLSDPNLKYPTNIYGGTYEDILDACYEMILKLHEQKLL